MDSGGSLGRPQGFGAEYSHHHQDNNFVGNEGCAYLAKRFWPRLTFLGLCSQGITKQTTRLIRKEWPIYRRQAGAVSRGFTSVRIV
jgi:hypothetical protein